MDLLIWSPPYLQDENSYPTNSFPFNFYFNQKLDIIEENALNEKCCLQVLEMLIAKADAEIAELKDDIVMLQSQLACTDEKWSDMCFAALNKKIGHLDSLITTLKHKNVQVSGVHLLTNRKPPERIHEILERLLRNFFSPREEQPANSSLGSSKLAAAGLIKVEATDNHDLKDNETVEINVGVAVQANVTVQIPSAVQERNHQEADVHTIFKASSKKAFGHASDDSTMKDLNKFDIPRKLINASKREYPSHLNNKQFACAVLKSVSTKSLKDEAQSCGTTKRKINISEDIVEDELMPRSSNDERVIINSSPEVEETSNGKGPKPAGSILKTSLISVKQEPKEYRDEQTQNGGKAGQRREKYTSSQLAREKKIGAKSFLGLKGEERSQPLEKVKGKVQEKRPSKSQVLTIHKSDSKLFLKLEGQRLNFKWNLPPEKTKEPCLAEELGFKTPSGVKLKRQKIGSTQKNRGDESGDETIKENMLLLGGAKGTGDLPEISSTSLTQLKNRRITSSREPVLQDNENLRDFQNRLVKSQDRSNQSLQVIKVVNVKPLASTAFIVPTPHIADLKFMTLNQLKAVARQLNLRGVYTLCKAELQEVLHFKLLAKGRST
ncbi:PREDICTED: uncharacterized protein LOC109242668 [Nicotiana attenuata]|uniref:Rho termination factor N-terminal domain-containing protein n=1 Tax=Nicotiana attenuata TaxID=49451 RepID=A0A1J6J367_NICAT|nr:PREDICTED: uncharacterized protein LOC109242668 [Nicotiana attenuata]OIT05387.1 hypothetical protein A4A49_31122 [Nicotiana attenuata]